MRGKKVKLCGLRRPEDIAAANEARPDYIGFVFAPRSRRAVTPEQARALRSELEEGIVPVGVFVNQPVELVAGLLNDGVIQVAQLHGQEDARYLTALRQRTKGEIWRAFRVETPGDVARAIRSAADLILLDNGSGGTGEIFDWSLVQNCPRPFLLAGGLTPENVGQALRQVRPCGVDTSSGVETMGQKDPVKMKRFVRNVRAFEE